MYVLIVVIQSFVKKKRKMKIIQALEVEVWADRLFSEVVVEVLFEVAVSVGEASEAEVLAVEEPADVFKKLKVNN